MRKAITTKFYGPTDRLGSRIRASAAGVGNLFISLEHELSIDGRHALAAKELAVKYGWHGLWVAGGMPDETGNCYVNIADAIAGAQVLGIENRDWFFVAEKKA